MKPWTLSKPRVRKLLDVYGKTLNVSKTAEQMGMTRQGVTYHLIVHGVATPGRGTQARRAGLTTRRRVKEAWAREKTIKGTAEVLGLHPATVRRHLEAMQLWPPKPLEF